MKRHPLKPRSTKTRAAVAAHHPQRVAWLQRFTHWRESQELCYCCEWRIGEPWPYSGWLARLEANHVFGHANREATRYAIWAIVMLCQWCHQEVWPRTKNRQRIVFGAVLKLRHDPKNFDLDAMNAMHDGEPIGLSELRDEMDRLFL